MERKERWERKGEKKYGREARRQGRYKHIPPFVILLEVMEGGKCVWRREREWRMVRSDGKYREIDDNGREKK